MKMKFYFSFGKILLQMGIFLWCFQAFGQSRVISGKVTAQEDNTPLPGVNVIVKGTTTGAVTDSNGSYSVTIPGNDVFLVFTFIGYTAQEVAAGNRSSIDIQMASDVKALQEVVVTGYTTQNRRDITGAVSVVKPQELLATPAGNVQQQLQGRVAGVVTSGTGVPGAGAKVRVRGFGSFGNNDPLYIVDGVPTYNVNNINPQDIESMQVLKDASAASIYGARAANGVVIMTTKKGKTGAPTVSIDSYYGFQKAPKGPNMLNPTQLGQLFWESQLNAGQTPSHAQYGSGAEPRFPDYVIAGSLAGVMEGHPDTDPALYNIDYARPIHRIVRFNKEGTDQWNELFRTAPIQSHQVTANGGTEFSNYSVGLNFFDQQGLMHYTGYKRYSLRANTQFKVKNRIRLGENVQVSYNEAKGSRSGEEGGESLLLNAIRIYPFIPRNDVMGNWAGTAGAGAGTGANSYADLYRSKDDINSAMRLFGNVYAEVDIINGLTARTSFGVDYETRYGQDYEFRTYERAENIGANAYTEQNDWTRNWTWTNTLTYKKVFAEKHDITLLAGTEAVKETGRGVSGRRINFFSDDPYFRVLTRGAPVGQNNDSYGFASTLSSVFGRVDYTFNDRYIVNATLRRDGSSRFGSENRYGVFPAASVGWRISSENFMKGVPFVNDLKLRVGWGQMGNQLNVDRENAYSFYRSTPGNSSYDLGGTGNSVMMGFDMDRIGFSRTKWEAATTTNLGIDAVLFDSRLDVALDVYNRTTEGLLVRAQAAGTLGDATLPFVNLGDIRNRGIDLTLGTRGDIGGSGLKYDVVLTLAHYKNEALRVGANAKDFIQGSVLRNVEITRSEAGQPISSFRGYTIDGFYNTQEEVDAGPDQPQKGIGSWRIRDRNNDGVINADDQSYIGSPHPDLTTGLNFTLAYKGFDLSIFLYSVLGNEIYNNTKWWTDFNSFQGNRSVRMLEQSWRAGADNSKAVLPILNATDTYSNSIANTYMVESGSYLRARTMQLGYNFPKTLISRLGMSNLRLYVQGQNIFTITNYTGVDPDVSSQSQITGQETGMGIDMGWYPNPKQFLLGLNLSF
ncbi:TonB-dependent receptor [Rhodocytophaga rosea]|uniref:TonB-dependent receptor n=1 Tax=Rhodocytophaga rosea TaxID=2704465 RepID=A0A6C0GI55_9BACT|nr:TonB-dependent receptor [Rhodocytophaga rosea]QHT67706.1 TonB-dependent receptor [Rhodocytophaga rosea]